MSKLLVDPGEYSCTWNLLGREYPGTIEFRPSGRTRGEIFDLPHSLEEGEQSESTHWSPRAHKHERLTGELRSGQTFILEDVRLDHWFMTRARVLASTAICGLGLDVEKTLHYDAVEFQTGGLVELSGKVPLVVTTPLGNAPKIFKVEWREEADYEWSNAIDKLRLGFHARYKPAELFSFSIVTSPVIEVSGRARSVDDWRREYVDTVRSLASIATGRSQPISWMLVKWKVHEERGDGSLREWEARAQVFSLDITQQPYEAERPDQPSASMINLADTGASLLELIDTWNVSASHYATFFELFQSVLRESLPLRAAFLALAPALESLHGQKYGSGKISIEEHRARRKEVLKNVRAAGVSSEDRKWLDDWLDLRGSYALHQRLRQLYASLDAEVRAAIDKKIDPIPAALGDIHHSATDVWEVIARLRNDLAHGGVSHSATEILAATHVCFTLAIALTLNELSVPNRNLTAAIESGLRQVV